MIEISYMTAIYCVLGYLLLIVYMFSLGIKYIKLKWKYILLKKSMKTATVIKDYINNKN